MTRKRSKAKGRRESGSYVALPHSVLRHENFASLSPLATKLFMDMASCYLGSNNGDFSAAWKVMKARGWKSKETLYKALHELVNTGFVITSRQGGRNRCSLYALTIWPIDECKGKLDIPATRTAPAHWKSFSVPRRSYQRGTESVPVSEQTAGNVIPLARRAYQSGDFS